MEIVLGVCFALVVSEGVNEWKNKYFNNNKQHLKKEYNSWSGDT